MAACGAALAADARAAYLAIVRVHLPLSPLRSSLPVVFLIGIGHHVPLLLFFDQSLVDHGDPALEPFVEFELGAIVLHGDILVVELGIRDAFILVELF